MAQELERLREIDDGARTEVDGNPPYDFPAYRSTRLRAPKRALLLLPGSLSERTGPVFGEDAAAEGDSDLTRQHAGEPLGERQTPFFAP